MSDTAPPSPATWTWADQVSTWRFWGLVAAYLLAVPVADALLFQMLPQLADATGATMVETSWMLSARHVATAFGFGFAWLAIRWKPVPALVLLALLKVGGLALLCTADGGTTGTRLVGAALTGLATGALALAVPALLAGGRHGAEAFLVTFGIASTATVLAGVGANHLVGAHPEIFEALGLASLAIAPVAAGALLFASVPARLFAEPPPARGRTLPPVARRPVVAALLWFVPFYGLYWLYRLHGEVAAVAPSRALLSPRAAAFGSLFVPFLWLAAMASLVDALNDVRRRRGEPPLRSAVTVFVWSLCFVPVAVGMVQSALNRVAGPHTPAPVR